MPSINLQTIISEIQSAISLDQILNTLKRVFFFPKSKRPDAYKDSDSDYGIKVSGQKARERINQQCRDILDRVNGDPDYKLTAEDLEILKQYSGEGGTSNNSEFEYYTPSWLAHGVWDALQANGFSAGNVLDPCVGAGVFPGTKPNGVIMSACDIDPVGSQIAGILNPSDKVDNIPFEKLVETTHDDTFDACVTNIPFGDARGSSQRLDAAYKNEKRVDRYFIQRILDKLRPNGLACLVCPTQILNSKGKDWLKFRAEISKKAEFLGAYKLPSKTFSRGMQGTDVTVDVVIFKKHSQGLLENLRNNTYTADILHEAKVLWDPFLNGGYWKTPEGQKNIMGEYVSKEEQKNFRTGEKVLGELDKDSVKRQLAQRLYSRIDYALLDQEEGIGIAYHSGDVKLINGSYYQLNDDGDWVKVQNPTVDTPFDEKTYGAHDREDLQNKLGSTKSCLNFTYKQASAIKLRGDLALPPGFAGAVQFASKQKEKLQEQVYRGSILGALLEKLDVDEAAGEDVAIRRQELQDAIVKEIETYGHPQNHADLKKAGKESRHYNLFMQSVNLDGSFSDLLAGKLNRGAALGYNDTNVSDIVNFLYAHGAQQIDIAAINRLYKGDTPLRSLNDLVAIDDIAITADGFILPKNRYLCGESKPLIDSLNAAIANTTDEALKGKYKKQIDELFAKIKHTPIDEINFSLQDKWFDRGYILGFLTSIGYPDASFSPYTEISEEGENGTFKKVRKYLEPDSDALEGDFLLYGDQPAKSGFERQLEKFLNGGKITSSNADKIYEYENKIKDTNQLFNAWMREHSWAKKLENQFALTFNSFIPFEEDTSKLDIEEYLSGEITPHAYQNAEVHRLSTLGCGICGFGTGLGKTTVCLALAAYNDKHGKSKKTCIVVPNAVLENWYHEAKGFYNEDFFYNKVKFVGLKRKYNDSGDIERKKVLDANGEEILNKQGLPVENDVLEYSSGQDVVKDMWDIPNNNYAIVVMSKEKFQDIPIKESTINSYTDFMVTKNLMEIEAEKEKAGKKSRSYSDDKRKKKLDAQFSDTGKEKKAQLPFIEDMGFDSIITDESHNYKNSMSDPKVASGVEGLPSPVPSQIAVDMNIKSYYIKQNHNGQGVYGLTATPVTNSPIEIFNMLSLVAPYEDFENRSIDTIKSFVQMFGSINRKKMFKVNGETEDVNVLSGFKNLGALREFFNKYVNVKNIQDVSNEIHVPLQNDINEEVDMTQEQDNAYEKLKLRIRYNGVERDLIPARDRPFIPEDDQIFSIMRDMDKCTTDIDMYKKQMTFLFPQEIKDSLPKIDLPKKYKYYEIDDETNKRISVEGDFEPIVNTEGDNIKIIIHEAQEKAFLKALSDAGIQQKDIAHPISPKYAKLIENVRKHLELNGKQIIFTEEKTQHNKIARILSNGLSIDPDLIAIINGEDAAGEKLDKIVQAYKSGQLKIVIANKKAEVGVNLQKGTTAIHHLTLPWTPASINQRNGRGVRQGNYVESVDVYYYIGKNTFDIYRKQALLTKSNWIDQLLKGETSEAQNADFESTQLLNAARSGKMEEYQAMKLKEAERQKQIQERVYYSRLIEAKNLHETLRDFFGRGKEIIADLDSEVTRISSKIIDDQHELSDPNKYYGIDAQEFMRSRIAKWEKKIAEIKKKIKKNEAKYSEENHEKLKARYESVKKILRQADKDGKLPFDISLVDNIDDICLDNNGKLCPTRGFIQFITTWKVPAQRNEYIKEGSIYYIASFNKMTQSIECQKYSVPDGTGHQLYNFWIAASEKVFVPIEVDALEKAFFLLRNGLMEYADIPKSPITEEVFYSNRFVCGYLTLPYGSLYIDKKYSIREVNVYGQFFPAFSAIYPDVDNPEFRKKVYDMLPSNGRSALTYTPPLTDREKKFLRKLFGDDFNYNKQ